MWVDDISKLGISANNPIYHWLTVQSITIATRSLCDELKIDVISQELDENNNLIRQVYLKADGIAWSYGRVEVPKDTYQKFKTQFDTLANRSIGEVLLHSNPKTQRSNFEYARIPVNSDLFKQATKSLPEKIDQPLWARRSIFTIDNHDLTVTELYFPAILLYI